MLKTHKVINPGKLTNIFVKKTLKKNSKKLQSFQFFKNIKSSKDTWKKAKNKRCKKLNCQQVAFKVPKNKSLPQQLITMSIKPYSKIAGTDL